MDDSSAVREVLRSWIALDDEARVLQAQLKELRTRKLALSQQVMEFMRGQNLDQFVLEARLPASSGRFALVPASRLFALRLPSSSQMTPSA